MVAQQLALFSAGFASCGLGLLVLQRLGVSFTRLTQLSTNNNINPAPTTKPNNNNNNQLANPTTPTELSPLELELHDEQYSRNVQFFGAKGQKKFENSFVVVVGLGGVGSHAAHLLVRSGIRRIRLIDFDQVSLSSLNRHAVAVREDVGYPKATVLAKYFGRFAPHCHVDARVQMFQASDADDLMSGSPDYVIDAIDDTETKLDLLEYCTTHNIKVLSSMGAGAKADPTRIHIGSLNDVSCDPLASRLRWRLKRRDLDPKDIDVIYSSEKAQMKLLPLDQDQIDNPNDFGALPCFRVRVIPVLGTLPASFGMAMASKIITDLAGKPMLPQPVPAVSNTIAKKALQAFYKREKAGGRSKTIEDVHINHDDVVFLLVQWRKRCAVSDKTMGTLGFHPTLVRWRFDMPATCHNMVLMDKSFAAVMEELAQEGKYPTPETFEGWSSEDTKFNRREDKELGISDAAAAAGGNSSTGSSDGKFKKKNEQKEKKDKEVVYGGRDLARDGATVFADIERQLQCFKEFGGLQ